MKSPRQRTLYRLTRWGEEALADWVSDAGVRSIEIRDEMLVRLFFSDVVEPERRVQLARSMAARHRAQASDLRGKGAVHASKLPESPMHQEVLRLGIDLHDFLADWYERSAERLTRD